MAALQAFRPTRIESCLAAVLLLLALVEALFSDEQPSATVFRVLAAAIPAAAVALSRSRPEVAATAVVCTLVLASLEASPSGTLGAGLSWLAVAFGLAAWSAQPWPWLLALVVAGTLRDLRAVPLEASNVIIDWVFAGFTVWMGRVVHHRSARADELTAHLEAAETERETRIKQAVAGERSVIARELHDIVAHSVSLMVVQAGTARPLARRVDDELAEVLQTIEDVGREALIELRRLLHVLRTEDEPEMKPVPDLSRLDDLIDSVRRAGVEVHAVFAPPANVPHGAALCAYRTVQEGLTNAMRYANGSRVDVDVEGDGRTLRVRIQDHGGTAPSEELGTGGGIAGLRERVLLCGGHLSARTQAAGFLLEVTLPLTDQALPAEFASPHEGEHP